MPDGKIVDVTGFLRGSGQERGTTENFLFDDSSKYSLIQSEYKMLLHPFTGETVTDAQAQDIADILRYKPESYFVKQMGVSRVAYVRKFITKRLYYVGDSINSMHLFQYLIKEKFAVPLWFDIGHWANGKTAIELGVAVEIPNRITA